jgi:hypothetical protein
MRNYLIIINVLILGLFAFASCDTDPVDQPVVTTEELAGGDFDTWLIQTQGEVSFDKPAGDWWDGLNYLSVIGGPITVTKTEDAYQGEHALRLETKMWGEELSIPGILASGYFDPAFPIGENLIIGKPYTKKPKSLIGFLKYSPADNDTLVIFVALTKYNSATSTRDTIASGEYTYSNEITSYTPFNVMIEYSDTISPDSIHVIFLASVSGKEMRGHAGSVLILDEIKFTYE